MIFFVVNKIQVREEILLVIPNVQTRVCATDQTTTLVTLLHYFTTDTLLHNCYTPDHPVTLLATTGTCTTGHHYTTQLAA